MRRDARFLDYQDLGTDTQQYFGRFLNLPYKSYKNKTEFRYWKGEGCNSSTKTKKNNKKKTKKKTKEERLLKNVNSDILFKFSTHTNSAAYFEPIHQHTRVDIVVFYATNNSVQIGE